MTYRLYFGRLRPNIGSRFLHHLGSGSVLLSRGSSRSSDPSSLCAIGLEVEDAATSRRPTRRETRYLTDTLAETERARSLRHNNQLICTRFSDGQGSQAKVAGRRTSCVRRRCLKEASKRVFLFIILNFGKETFEVNDWIPPSVIRLLRLVE